MMNIHFYPLLFFIKSKLTDHQSKMINQESRIDEIVIKEMEV